jgi:GT2 family glycosyltransferase
MTSSLVLQTYKETTNVSLGNFKTELMKLLPRLAPEYIDLTERHEDYVLPGLRGILEYWSGQLSVAPMMREKFLEAKIVECLAFWNGYFKAGGRNEFPKAEKSLPSSNACEPSSKRQISVVIPVGSINAQIRQIMNFTLRALHQNSSIVGIYCVYDGILPIQDLEFHFPKVQTLFIPKRAGPATARNLGMHSGFRDGFSDVLLLDSDVLVTAQQVDKLLYEYHRSCSAISCPLVFAEGETWFDYYHDINGTLNGRYLCASQGKDLLFGTTSCMFVSRDVYDAGISFSADFAEAAGEDIDFCIQALFAGFSITALDNVVVFHKYGYNEDDLYNWRHFRSRYERYGRGEVRVLQKHPYYCHLFSQSQERTCRARMVQCLPRSSSRACAKEQIKTCL